MNVITQELDDMVTELQSAGVPATNDPSQVLPLLATNPAVAVVMFDGELRIGLGAGRISIDVETWLVTAPPLDRAAVERLHEAIIPAARAAIPATEVTRDRFDTGDGELPAYRWSTARAMPYPT